MIIDLAVEVTNGCCNGFDVLRIWLFFGYHSYVYVKRCRIFVCLLVIYSAVFKHIVTV